MQPSSKLRRLVVKEFARYSAGIEAIPIEVSTSCGIPDVYVISRTGDSCWIELKVYPDKLTAVQMSRAHQFKGYVLELKDKQYNLFRIEGGPNVSSMKLSLLQTSTQLYEITNFIIQERNFT
jgi:RecB family endonuclease NucS